MKLFKIITTVQGVNEQFVDWFKCEDKSQVGSLWQAECIACGVPVAKAIFEIVECNPETLKPIKSTL